jgi:hypothetical protein
MDWLGWLKKLEFTAIGAIAIAGLCLMIGQSAENYADATAADAARLAARDAKADRQGTTRFNVIDYSATGAIKGRVQAATPCKIDD